MKKFLRRGVVTVGLVFLLMVLIVGGRTVLGGSAQLEPSTVDLPKVRDGFDKRLARAIRFKTTSDGSLEKMNLEEFDAFHAWLEKTYPKVHSTLTRDEVKPCSVAYAWKGSDPNLPPALLLSHIDVVPVEEHAIEQWTQPPFKGAIKDGYIWGRGALDDKFGVIGILEATETLIEAGVQPKRSHVFAFGCDEEVGGNLGAKRIAERFRKDNTNFAYIIDEGHIIGKGLFPGTTAPIAFIGLAEKGFLTVQLTATQEGGHSSMPPQETAVGILTRAVSEVERNQMPANLNEPTQAMFQHIAPEVGFPNSMVFSNLWLFKPVVLGMLTAKPTTNAGVRTTTAPTILRAGVQDNVLPKKAEAKINFRIAPGDTVEEVVSHVSDVIDDERVKVEFDPEGFHSNPSNISSPESDSYRSLAKTIRGVFGKETIVVPALTVGGTDARHYQTLSENVYRFAPLELGPGDPARIHGVDERISVDNYRKVIRFYMALLVAE